MKRTTKTNATPTVKISLPDLRRLSGFNRLLIAVLVSGLFVRRRSQNS